jgi:hypothetical protein
VDVYPLLHNALPWPKSSRSTGYTFSQTALRKFSAQLIEKYRRVFAMFRLFGGGHFFP